MRRVKIAIDPLIKARYGPEVCWTWRLLLSAMGLAWEEVPASAAKSDIAYMAALGRTSRCRLFVRANLEAWEQRAAYRLGSVAHHDGWGHPVYEGEVRASQQFVPVDGRLICERDLIFDVFWLATGQEERQWPKDKHGHFDLRGTAFQREEALRLALGSSIGSALQQVLTNLGFTDAVPRWPDGKHAAACVSHDVDYPEVVRWLEPLRIVSRQGLRGLRAAVSVLNGHRTHWHFPSWSQMERSLKTRSAFYFVARQGSLLEYACGTPDPFYNVQSHRFRNLFKYLADEGFEIGLHASYRAFESRERFAAEKAVLEEASGQRICGNRHHYWHLKPEDLESTLLIHEQIGLVYDTSLAHERYAGWRRGLSWPYFPFHGQERRELRTLQIPTVWMDDHLFGYQAQNPGDRGAVLRTLAETAAAQAGCLLIDVHDFVFDDHLFPGWAKSYMSFLEYLVARRDFWIDTPSRIASHWIDRCSLLRQSSLGLT
ncbi:MAG: polysaccharide deacetylase family protein [bacterium]